MKTYNEICEEYANEENFDSFQLLLRHCEVPELVCEEIARRYAREALSEAADKVAKGWADLDDKIFKESITNIELL